MAKKKSSIEETVELWAKEQLKGLKLYPKTDFINPQIEKALKTEPSKTGGKGSNYPDIKCLISTPDGDIPVMIEVKGTVGSLIKLDADGLAPENSTKKGDPNYANIAKYAVNGAVHYANAILRNTTYKDVIAIGVNGYEDATGIVVHEVSVWYISRLNLFIPKEVARYSDLSFLKSKFRKAFLVKVANMGLSDEEIEQQKAKLEDDIERKLKDLNQKMEDELQIVVNQRVQLVTGFIMAGLGVKEGDAYKVMPLQEEDLHGDTDEENNDGAIIMRKIKSYLKDKKLPAEKIDMIVKILSVVFQHSHLEEPKNGESKLRTLYRDVKSDIIPFLTGELHNLDFTGRLFNVLNAWVDVPDGAENDVVLTPRYVTEFMARLCQVNKDSYVWDFATGSAGFLISAMHLMIADAQNKIANEQEKLEKILHIKTEQLLGVEKLADIYLLAVLNMILMKDGSANIIHGNSLTEFDGKYEQGELKGKEFPATVFLLNPPYSADGKGFVFVKKALSLMTHGGMAAVLIQENAGSGKGFPYTKDILATNSLVASIKMPIDLFIGKSSVQTAIYVFEVGRPHSKENIVKFIDFSEDGYSRMNRRHSSQSVNLRDTGNARERYAEVVKLVRFGRGINDENLCYLRNSYIEDHISLEGNDWTFSQHRSIDAKPSENDIRRAVKQYLAWRVSDIILYGGEDGLGVKDCSLTKLEKDSLLALTTGAKEMKMFSIVKVFGVTNSHNILKSAVVYGSGKVPYVTASEGNNSVVSYISYKDSMMEHGNSIMIGGKTLVITYQPKDFFSNDSHNLVLMATDKKGRSELVQLFMVAALYKTLGPKYSWGDSISKAKIQKDVVCLPVLKDGKSIDYSFMENCISAVKKQCIASLKTTIEKEQSDYLDTKALKQDPPLSVTRLIRKRTARKDRYVKYLPLYSVRAACGYFEDGGVILDDMSEGWVDVSNSGIKINNQMFLVHAVGNSMLPKIKDGDLCLFELYGADGAGSREGEIVLTQCSGKDDDYECCYTIKKYNSEKVIREDGWQHSRIQLSPLNPEYNPIELNPDGEGEYRTIAILKAVIKAEED